MITEYIAFKYCCAKAWGTEHQIENHAFYVVQFELTTAVLLTLYTNCKAHTEKKDYVVLGASLQL